MKIFPDYKGYERLKTLKGVIRNRDLSLATPEKIKTAIGK